MPDDASDFTRTELFGPLGPYDESWLDVGDGHEMRFEQSGNPAGQPVLFVHGGPASGASERQRRFFDPQAYRIILFDQRGSGRSRPEGERNDNTTAHLVGDIERLRAHLGIARWLVFGGSWGSALALAWAGAHRHACAGLILRGIFLSGKGDMDWFFEHAGQLYPDAWQRFADHVGGVDFRSILDGYRQRLEAVDTPVAADAVAQWLAWESTLSSPQQPPVLAAQFANASPSTQRKYRLQASYLDRLCDLGDTAVLAAAQRVADLPTAIVHGRLDHVCRPVNAWRLAQSMPGARVRLLAAAAHDPWSVPMVGALTAATDCFIADGDFRHWPGIGLDP